MKHISQSIEFITDKFNLTGELDDDLNAGNQFYGEDLSKWLSSALCLRGWESDYLDEDWGWLIFASKHKDSRHEICVYAYPEAGQQTNRGAWSILIHTRYKAPFLGFFTRMRYGSTDMEIVNDVIAALKGCGITEIISKKQDGFNWVPWENA